MTARGAGSPAGDSPPPELVARFRAALDRLWPEGGKLGLAVSGGPDSLAMLLLADAAIPGQFEVATVDHGLRPESAAECEMVARLCADRDIRCAVLEATVDDGNLQAEAREARYSALIFWAMERGLSGFATAHHADDQVETMLMRLNRGSGVSGLAGIREREGRFLGSEIQVIRPLLGFLRVELAEVVQLSSLEPIQDPSNTDDRFDRTRIRKALFGTDWLDAKAVAASAANLAKVDEALFWVTQREWSEKVSVSEGVYRYRRPSLQQWLAQHVNPDGTFEYAFDRAPDAIVLELVKLVMMHFDAQPRGKDLVRLFDRLEAGRGGNLAGVLVTVEGDEWVFRREPPRRTG